jgi:hypothetical protein
MERMETIASINAEFFIKKHFINLDPKGSLVQAMRESIRETIKNALIAYEMQHQQG